MKTSAVQGLFQILQILIVFLAASTASADWQGSLRVHGTGGSGHGDTQGKIFAQGQKMRVEINAQGRDVVVLSDLKARQFTLLMDQQKMAMDIPENETTRQITSCSTDDVDACFKKKGFKQTGKETVAGHPCSILEGTEKNGEFTSHQKIWRPLDLKEVFLLKSMTRLKDGNEVTMEIKDIKLGKQSSALFAVPAGYRRMQMPGLPGGLQAR